VSGRALCLHLLRLPTRGAGCLDPVIAGMTSRLLPLKGRFPAQGVGSLQIFHCIVGVILDGLRMLDKRGIVMYDN